MSFLHRSISFSTIMKTLIQNEAIIGVFVLRDPTKGKSLIDKILSLNMYFYTFIFIQFCITTCVITNFELISIFLVVSIIPPFIFSESIWKLIWNRKIVEQLMKWCESLYDVDKKFHKGVQAIAINNIRTAQKQSEMMLKWLRIFMYSDAVVVSVGYAFIGKFLPAHIYPKWSPPLPFYLPFKKQNTPISYFCTLTLQTTVSFQLAMVTIFSYGYCFCAVFHIIAFFNTISNVIECIKKELERDLNDPSLAVAESSLSFNDWTKILVNMISEVNSVMTTLCQLYTEFFFLIEFASLGTVFICGLWIMIVRQQIVFAIGLMVTVVFLYVFCFINEFIMDKMEGLKQELYDLPWYKMNVKDRKLLVLLMICDQTQTGFTAMGIHKMTIERFAIVLRVGYTNLLILKDLIIKS